MAMELLNVSHIVRRRLIYIVVQPVGEKKLAGGTPGDDGSLGRIVVREIIHRNLGIHSTLQIPEVFQGQRVSVVLGMAGYEEVAAVCLLYTSDAADD